MKLARHIRPKHHPELRLQQSDMAHSPTMNRADRRRRKKLGGAGATASASTLQSAFEETARLHHDGRLSEAEKGYRQILSLAPGHPDACI